MRGLEQGSGLVRLFPRRWRGAGETTTPGALWRTHALAGPLFGLLLVFGMVEVAGAQDTPAREPGRIIATGIGEVERAPDFARIFVSVTNRADTLADAVSANRTATDDALAAVEARGIAPKDVSTADFQVYETPEEYDRDGNRRPVPAYTATHQVQIVLRDLSEVGAFAGEILALDAMTFQSIVFGLERSEQAEEEAMRLAVSDARRQAEVLADAAGVSLGAIRRIGDGGADTGPLREMDRMAMRASSPQAVPIVPPAQLTFTARVGIEWSIAR